MKEEGRRKKDGRVRDESTVLCHSERSACPPKHWWREESLVCKVCAKKQGILRYAQDDNKKK